MASPQCLGYSRYRKVTRDLCAPPRDKVVKTAKETVERIQASFLFIATDNDPMLDEFRQVFESLNVSVSILNSLGAFLAQIHILD